MKGQWGNVDKKWGNWDQTMGRVQNNRITILQRIMEGNNWETLSKSHVYGPYLKEWTKPEWDQFVHNFLNHPDLAGLKSKIDEYAAGESNYQTASLYHEILSLLDPDDGLSLDGPLLAVQQEEAF
jgi:hypothetical protein